MERMEGYSKKEEMIKERIVRDAEREAEDLLEKAKASAQEILEEGARLGAQDASKEAEEILSRAKEEAEALKRRIVSDAKMKGAWQILSEKRSLIEEVLEEARKALRNWSEKEKELYIQALRGLILKDALELGGGQLEVLLNHRDASLPLDLEALSHEVEKKTGRKTRISVGLERLHISGGILLRTADGKMSIDDTFEGILERRRKQIETIIAGILFREG
jgi:V/A-type H+-transporting ATPase subunit E